MMVKSGRIRPTVPNRGLAYLPRCDGELDCPQKEDEDCVEVKASSCDPTYFRCQSGRCIPGRWKCDHDMDCRSDSWVNNIAQQIEYQRFYS